VVSDFWQVFWLVFEVFFFLAYLILLFRIIGDLIRDTSLGGFAMAAWIFGLIVFPLVTALAYLIVRGRGMAMRQHERAAAAEQRARQYVQSVAGTSPAQQIADAKALLDSGVITQAEFEQLKAKAMTA
jgi:hypothetical protein